LWQANFEDIKGGLRRGELKDIQVNGQNKKKDNRTNNNLLVEQVLLTLPEHLSPPPVFSGVLAALSLLVCVCFVDYCLFCCPFFYFDH
jgi:hypothetical protein